MLLVALIGGALMFVSRDASAVLNPGIFELDGNAITGNTTDGATTAAPTGLHDWDQVFAGTSGADKAAFIEDYFPGADDQPSTGATKDTNDIDGWDCKSGVLSPPKNDMANAFVVSYTINGHQIIYFGLDRVNSDNGNANVGFWFLKGQNGCDPAVGDFIGPKHSQGDTLVTSSFTGGGIVSTILIFEWCSDPDSPDLKCGNSESLTPPAAGKGDGPLQLVFAGADCRNADGSYNPTYASGLACATVNRSIDTYEPPWPYTGAGSTPDTYERGAFFEGGIDATGLDLDLSCVGTFIADTRSSQSPTAQLHDFAIASVDLCDTTISTTSSPTGSVAPGPLATDSVTVQKSASTPGAAPAPTGTVDFYLCGPGLADAADADDGCPNGGTKIGVTKTLVSGNATSDATTATQTTAEGLYCWRAEYSGDDNYPSNSHTNNTTECFTVAKQASTTATTSSPTGGNVVPGTSVSDTATVTGSGPTPTGTVTFFLCQPGDITAGGCEGTAGAQVGSAKALSSGQATSDASTNTTAIGKYCWRAEYSGDSYYLASSHTNATSECFTTVKQPSTTATTSSPTGGNVVPGTSVTDTATVTGGTGQPTPTGSVTFYLCQPGDVTAGGCEGTAGAQVGVAKTLNASGQATSDASTNTTAIGKYCWRAEYSGDGFYNASSHTNNSTECFTTVKQPSTTATTSSPTGGNVVPGTSVTDTATVTGGTGQPTPTGSVTFHLCQPGDVTAGGCEGTAGAQVGVAKTLDGSGQATSDASTNTTAIGKYCWRAEYSGDDFYNASSHTNSTSECFTTVKQPSTTATASSPTGGGVVPGTSVTDTATVTGGTGQPTPTGTVTFFLCQPAGVEGTGCPSGSGTQIGDPVALDASGQATSESTSNTTTIGKYCWRAEYSGDDFYNGSSHTNATSECFTTAKQPSQTATTSNPTGGNVVPGTSVTDSATVTGGSGQPTPTGTVDFYLCQPNEVTAVGCPDGAGTQVGASKTLNASGQATSDATTNTTTIGKYCWRAVYSGDSFYDGSNHTNNSTECFTTVKQPSTTATTSSPTNGNVVPGTSATDTATVTGGTGQPTPTGTVDFYLCQPNEVTAAGCQVGAGTKIGATKTLDANGQATSDATTNTTAIGKYCWRAVYSGDSFYNGSNHTNATTECFTTVKQPSTTATTSSPTGGNVTPGTSVTDSATVTGGSGQPTPTGTVDFYLCQPNEVTAAGCPVGAGTKIGATKTLNASGQATSDATTNTTAGGKYCWRAVYSGDSFYNGSNHTNATTECFTVVVPNAQLAPTATTCSSFKAGTAADLTQINYSVKNGKISQVDPGVFFYWMKVEGGGTYTIEQTATPNFKKFALTAGSAVFDTNCQKVNSATITQGSLNNGGTVTITFSGTGTFYIGIKYDTGSVKGETPPAGNGIVHYDFEMKLNGNIVAGSKDGLDLKPKS